MPWAWSDFRSASQCRPRSTQVRVHGELLKDQHFALLSSDVSVSASTKHCRFIVQSARRTGNSRFHTEVFARIPWRNLGSEPTVTASHSLPHMLEALCMDLHSCRRSSR